MELYPMGFDQIYSIMDGVLMYNTPQTGTVTLRYYYNATSDGDHAWKTSTVVRMNDNFAYCIVLNPFGGIGDKVEVAILVRQGGSIIEDDYGIVTKSRQESQHNEFLEKVVLPNGSTIVIRDKLWLYSFNVNGIPGKFYMPNYTFVSEK